MSAPRVISIAGYLALLAALLVLLATRELLATNPILAVQICAGLLMIWARLTFGRRSFHLTADPTAGGLVTNGPYALIRHPIYSAILLFLLAAVVSHPSARNIGLGVLAVAGAVARLVCEERLLRVRYPQYADYSKKTKRLLPFVY